MYLVFEFGLGIYEIKFDLGIHGEVVYSIVNGGHWRVVVQVLDEEWAKLPKELWLKDIMYVDLVREEDMGRVYNVCLIPDMSV